MTGSRRYHSKSKNGCGQCKARRKKCDQKAPRCGSCLKLGFRCDYEANFTFGPPEPTFGEGISIKFEFDKLSARPDLPAKNAHPAFPVQFLQTPLYRNLGTISPAPGLNQEDLELMQHYYTSTSISVIDISKLHIWQNLVPHEATNHPWLLESLLSFSALHLAILYPPLKKSYSAVAIRHQSKASALFRSSVVQIEQENCDAMMLFSGLSVLCEVVMLNLQYEPNEQGDLDIVDNLLRLFTLVRRLVHLWLSSLHLLMRAKITGMLVFKQRAAAADAQVAPHVYAALINLRLLNESTTVDPGDRVVYAAVIKVLSHLAENVVKYPDEWPWVMRWANLIPARFLELLRGREMLALVILAHYCVIVHHSQKLWCMQGWSEKVFHALVRTVNEDWQPSLDWAAQGMKSPSPFIMV